MRQFLFAVVIAGLVASGIRPHDYFTWFLEVLPILLGLPIVYGTRRKFPLTTLSYVLLTVHSLILCLGAKYTYAEVPLGFWMKDWFGFSRNCYDRIGHFAQGFVPAILIREFLLRKTALGRGKILIWLVLSACLAISALYELFEAIVAGLTGNSADAFLGTQGDVWDTQWDMGMALIGAICALVCLSRIHDKKLRGMK